MILWLSEHRRQRARDDDAALKANPMAYSYDRKASRPAGWRGRRKPHARREFRD